MKKILFLLCIIVAVLSTKYFASHKSGQSVLLLYNIEALAADDEYPLVSHRKVEYIAGGYSLEDLY